MRQIIAFAVLALVIGTLAPKYLMNAAAPQANLTAASQPAAKPAAGGTRSVTLFSDRTGHYATEAMVGAQRVSFLVDTGATAVTLRESDAARLGIFPREADYKIKVSTANGTVTAARAWLSRIDIGDITVHDIDAIVMPDRALGTNLLGMSFLSRVQLQQQNGKLVIEQ
jgi:aspartyl protease family protein